MEADDGACLKRLQSIVSLGCPVDQTRDLKTLLYCTASGKMRCVAFLMDQGVRFADTDACMRVAALAARYALESWANVDSKKAREEMGWREKQGAALVKRGCPLLPPAPRSGDSECGAGASAGSGGDASGGGAGGADPSGGGAGGADPSDEELLTARELSRAQAGLLTYARATERARAAKAAAGIALPEASEAGDRAADPVYRYDPERARYVDADFGASVPAILGIRDFCPDHRDAGSARFTTWKVAAKQKVAADIWAAWCEAAGPAFNPHAAQKAVRK
jgi:hypothetical protein